MSKNTKHPIYKKYLSLLERKSVLTKIQRNLGYIELDKPRHHGYIHYYELRDDISRSPMAPIYQELIDNFFKPVWTKEKEGYPLKKGKFSPIIIKSSLLRKDKISKLNPKIQKYHLSVKTDIIWGNNIIELYYSTPPLHYFVMKTKKHYITHIKVIDGEIESELTKIHDELYLIRKKINPYNKGGYKKFLRKINKSTRAKNKSALHKMLKSDDFNDERGNLLFNCRNSAKWYYF